MFFHGYGSYGDKFAYIARHWSDSLYDVIAYDYKGFGHSEGPRSLINDTKGFC